MNPNGTRPRTLGILYILAFLTYGGGNALVDDVLKTSGPPGAVSSHLAQLITGAMLMSLVHSAILGGIGVLMMAVLWPHGRTVAWGYMAAATATAVLLTVGTVFLLLQAALRQSFPSIGPAQVPLFDTLVSVLAKGNFYAYQSGMAVWSLAGLFLCRLLHRARLIAPWLAAWGLAGYLVFLAGCLLEMYGLPLGVLLSVPGGLFEIVLALLLIFEGFRQEKPVLATL